MRMIDATKLRAKLLKRIQELNKEFAPDDVVREVNDIIILLDAAIREGRT